jgi:hypothetical protein
VKLFCIDLTALKKLRDPDRLILEGLQLANKLGNHFVTNNPIGERATQF